MEKVIGIVVLVVVLIVFFIALLTLASVLGKWQKKRVNPFKKFHHNKKNEKLTVEELRAISIGAILAEVNSDYCDSLGTTNVKVVKTIAQLLSRDWGITSGAEAVIVLDQLKTLRSSQHMNLLLKHAPECFSASGINVNQLREEADMENFNANLLMEYAGNLKTVIGVLTKRGFINDKSELVHMNAEAWDMGRMVNVARYCYDCGYLTAEQAWSYIFYAYEKSADCYQNWSDFAKGYVVARAIWGGENLNLSVAIDTALELQKNPKSPWMAVSLH